MARVVAVFDDLLLGSNVLGVLKAAGHDARLAGAAVDSVDAEVVVVDLGSARLRRRRAGRAAARVRRAGRARTLGVYSHVDHDVKLRAEAAGFDLVVPRSRMAREGAALVERLVGSLDSTPQGRPGLRRLTLTGSRRSTSVVSNASSASIGSLEDPELEVPGGPLAQRARPQRAERGRARRERGRDGVELRRERLAVEPRLRRRHRRDRALRVALDLAVAALQRADRRPITGSSSSSVARVTHSTSSG